MNDLSSNVATGGLNRDSGDDSAGVASMSTPNKKSRLDPDEICLGTAINSNSINLPAAHSRFSDPGAEEKMRSAAAVLPGGTVGAEAHLDNNNNSANQAKLSIALSDAFSDPMKFVNKCFPDMHELHLLALSLRESLQGMRETANDTPIFNHTTILLVQVQTSSFTQEIKTANIKSGDRKHMQIVLLIFAEVADGRTKKAAETRFSF